MGPLTTEAALTAVSAAIHTMADVREALAVRDDAAVLLCDARDRESTKRTLIGLVQHALAVAP